MEIKQLHENDEPGIEELGQKGRIIDQGARCLLALRGHDDRLQRGRRKFAMRQLNVLTDNLNRLANLTNA